MSDFEEWIDQFLIDHSGDLSEDEAHILETGIQSLTAKLERAKEALYGVTLVKPIDHTDEHGTPLDLAQKVASQALKDIENE